MQELIDTMRSRLKTSPVVVVVLILCLLPFVLLAAPFYVIWKKTSWTNNRKTVVTIVVAVCFLSFGTSNGLSKAESKQPVVTAQGSEAQEDSQVFESPTEAVPLVEEALDEQAPEEMGGKSPYMELTSDTDSFLLLLESVGECYIGNNLSQTTYDKMEGTKVQPLVEDILNYKFDNGDTLSPQFSSAFTKFFEDNDSLKDYPDVLFALEQSFNIEFIQSEQAWGLVPKELYIDALGYLAPGVLLYSKYNDEWACFYEVLEVQYDCFIDDNYYGMAVMVKDIPVEEGEDVNPDTYWQDGDILLNAQRKITGEPLYYVRIDDPNLPAETDTTSIAPSVEWLPASQNLINGVMLYYGDSFVGDTKGYTGILDSVDLASGVFYIQYSSGNIEAKDLSVADQLWVRSDDPLIG